MKLEHVTVKKEFKLGLANYSNVTASVELSVAIDEGERVDWNALWDEVNAQVANQTDLDASWIKSDDFKNHYKITVRVPKERE